MAEVLDTFEFERGPGTPGSKWDKYLDGRIHRLNGDDLDGCTPTSAQQVFYKKAAKSGRKVRTRKGADWIVVQAYDPSEAA